MREFSTHDQLLTAVDQIAEDPRGWDGRTGRALLAYTLHALTPLARLENLDPADSVAIAWSSWGERGFRRARDAWAWTRSAVKRELAREKFAQDAQTSRQGLERQGMEHFVAIADDGLDSAAILNESETRPSGFSTLAMRTAQQILVRAGHSEDTAEAVLESMLELASACASPRGAYDQVARERRVPDALGVEAKTWRTLCALVLGNSAGDMGLVEAELRGVAPESVKNIRNAERRLLNEAA